MKRPTQQDIAVIAGMSQVAVSMALRDHPRISEENRARVKEIARQIGYRPDPALLALSTYRHEVVKSQYKATLAWVNFHHTSVKLQPFAYELFKGAQDRGSQLGYNIEEFLMDDLDNNVKRLSEVLYSRNVQGVFFAPQPRPVTHINRKAFAWDRFSLISFGFTLVRPMLDVVIDGQYRGSRLAVRKMWSLGYRRIGFVINTRYHEQTDGNLLAGYLCEQIRFSPGNRIPPLILNIKDRASYTRECRKWLRRYKPDAIFDTNSDLQISVPKEEYIHCGIASHSRGAPTENGVSGIYQNPQLIGWIGANELISMINMNIRGIPAYPRRILIESVWVQGESTPRVAVK